MSKEAIIFIVDANHTMDVPYNNATANPEGESITRLTAVKEAVLEKIATMAWQSSTHEFGVVILKTRYTHHHLYDTSTNNISKFFTSDRIKVEDDDVPFPNLIEIELTRPSHHILNAIKSIRATASTVQTPEADFCQSLILAADTLYRRTANKKYKRSIVLFTDAEHEVDVDGERLECVLNGLKKMDVSLEVVGLGFREEGVFVKQEDEDDVIDVDENDDNNDDEEEVVDLCVDDEEASDSKIHAEIQPDSHDFRMLIKRENEKLLLSHAQQTGGAVLAANGQNITTLLESYRAKNSESSNSRFTRNKCEFKITPNLTIETRYSKMVEQKSLPSLKRDAYLLDGVTGQPMKDGGGEFMTTPIDSIIYHTLQKNPDNPEDGTIEVPQESRTDAYRFGSDLIPLGKMDMAGINSAFKSPKSVEMIGYIPSKDVIQSGLTLGPAYALYGGKESNRSMTAVAALAEAMNVKDLWGFCRFVKSANGDPRLAVLVPRKIEQKSQVSSESSNSGGWYLALLQLPFADDVNVLKPPEVPTDHLNLGDYNESNVCDELIDSLMIADDELDSITISHPALKSYHRMIAHFAMNPITDEEERKVGLPEERILEACRATPLCELESVKMMSKKASNQIDSFLKTYPLTKSNIEGKKSERKYWGDGN